MAYTTIDDPSAYFQVALHSSANTATITNDGNSNLQPDLIWSKARGAAHNHGLYDSTRGVTKFLNSNTTSAEGTASAGYDLISFDTDGFSTGNNQFNTICGGTTYVAWQWKANGGTTVSNTDGDITSTVQVNSDAGFSIVTDSPPNSTARSIGHGLGVAPQVVIRRARNRVENWRVFHSAAGSTGALMLDDNSAYNSNSVLFTGVTSTTFGVGTDFSVNGGFNYVSYCFAEKQGYSKFGKYVGNGIGANGPFVYTGFKPAFVLIKVTSHVESWLMFDSSRKPFNTDNNVNSIYADSANAEYTGASYANVNLLSNGFKVLLTNVGINQSGASYIYMAFAENPFTTSTGVPTTAR